MKRRTTKRNLLCRSAHRLLGVVILIGLGCTAIKVSSVEHGNVSFDISPDGQQVVFVSADGDLYCLHLQTLRVTQLTATAATEVTPAFSPDGKFVAYAAEAGGKKGGSLFVRSLDGKEVRQLTDVPGTADSMPSYSSNGSHIVFARAHRHRRYSMGGWTWDDWDLYMMKSDGTQLRRITQQKYYGVSSPKFTADGTTIVYSAKGDRAQLSLTSGVFSVGTTEGRLPNLLTKDYPSLEQGGAWGSEPDIASDGASIVFISDRVVSFNYDVFIMNRDGTEPKALGVTKISRYNQHPVFFPGRKSLLFLAGREWNAGSRPIFSLWQVDADGKNPKCVAESELFTRPLRWKPKRMPTH